MLPSDVDSALREFAERRSSCFFTQEDDRSILWAYPSRVVVHRNGLNGSEDVLWIAHDPSDPTDEPTIIVDIRHLNIEQDYPLTEENLTDALAFVASKLLDPLEQLAAIGDTNAAD